ncbi:MAG: TonB-dependent receptor plug domain-containing protein [Bryobacterales bacterium]|nr:TonB-dependent receptor plug domain-containing protein [Bryobacterales bacterium]
MASGEKAGLLTSQQINQIAIKGRDFFGLMLTVPGVVDDFSQSREATSYTGMQGIYINGGRGNQKNFTVDGVTAMDTGSNYATHYEPNMDAIAEVKILTSNFQAEFGRNSGGVISVITKSGTQQFHGSAYDFYRHESLNANNFFSNPTGTPKLPYRYRISGYSLGGPVYIPKTFNTDRSKLFFFWSEEFTGVKKDFGTRFVNMPTAAERVGDFSQSFDVNGRLLPVVDPLTGAPYPRNVVPQSRINKLGQNILNFFPLPNYLDPDPLNRYRWNYRAAYSGNYPRRQELVRVDWNALPGLQIYYRYVQDKDEQITPWGIYVNGSTNYLLDPVVLGVPGKGHVFHVTRTFSPTLVNEFSFGKDRNQIYTRYTDPSLVDRSRLGNPAQWFQDPPGNPTNYYPGANPIPDLVFGGQPINPVNAA